MLLLLWTACTGPVQGPEASPPPPLAPREPAAPPPPIEPPPLPERRLTLVAVGDVLPHRRVKKTAADAGWSYVFDGVADRLHAADIAFANLESPVAPDHHKGIHGEVFDAPATLLPGLREAGFDVLAMANNHVWDQGPDGMLETRERVKAAGMRPVGTGATCAEARAPVIVEHAGLRVAFVAFTDLLNAAPSVAPGEGCVFVPGERCTADCLPDRDAEWFPIEAERVHAALRDARADADVVVLSAHWQTQYHTEPLPEYRPLARGFLEAGADVVLGHHPHVLQPVEVHPTPRGTGVIAYSLGNFVSDMGRRYTPEAAPRRGDTRDGGLLELSVRVQGPSVRVEPTLIPTWTENTERIRVVAQSALPEPLRGIRAARVGAVVAPLRLEDPKPEPPSPALP